MHLWNMNPFIAILAETLLSLNHYDTHKLIVNHTKTPRYILITFSGLTLDHSEIVITET